jgi:hypothetical protein
VACLVERDGHQRHQRTDEIIDALRGHSIFLPFFSIPYIILSFCPAHKPSAKNTDIF